MSFFCKCILSPKIIGRNCPGTKRQGRVDRGRPAGTIANFDAADLLLKGKTIIGIIEGYSIADIFIPQLIEFYKSGQFLFDRLIQYYDFSQINEAILDMKSGKTIKPILRIDNNAK